MYDNEEEIKRKRRNLLITIGVVIVVIILLLILIVSGGSKGGDPPTEKKMGCELEVTEGTQGPNGVYTTQVTVGFKNIDKVSDKYQVDAKIGTTENNPRNKETYTITKSGTYQLNGYVKDERGNSGTCSIEVKVSLSEPSCELEIKSGTLGSEEWYTTDVEVGFKTMSSNSEEVKIEKYYLEEEIVSLDDEEEEVTRADRPTAQTSETYKVTKNQITNVKGYVIDTNGVIGTCKITVKKDSQAPTCKLKVESGTPNDKGLYTDTPVIGFAEYKDETSDIAEKGIGIEKNYTEETYAVTAEGTTKVVGYVKDKAGNEGTCTLEIKRPKTSTPDPTPPTPGKTSYPTCSITLSGKGMGSGVYLGNVTATLKSSTTNGASISQTGIGTSQAINGKTSYVVSKSGSYTIYGMVKDSYGNVGYCSKKFSIKSGYLLYDKVNIGDYVDYNAGVWNDGNGSVSTADETFSGYTSGTSKNNGVKCSSNDSGVKHGWVVMSKSNGKVILVHAGTPECFYHSNNVAASTAISKMNQRAQGYINSNYAESASALSCSIAGVNCTKGTYMTGFHVTGTHYYLATASGNGNVLWGIAYDGRTTEFSRRAYGIRPVIVLKSSVLTTGSKNSRGAWVLTK